MGIAPSPSSAVQATTTQADQPTSGSDFNKMSIMAQALYMMFDSIVATRDAIKSKLDALRESAKTQKDLNKRIKNIHYEKFPDQLPTDPDKANQEIDRVNAKNAQLDKKRSALESQVLTFRQGAKVDMTTTQAAISSEQTYASQASNTLKVQNDVTKKVNRMNERVN